MKRLSKKVIRKIEKKYTNGQKPKSLTLSVCECPEIEGKDLTDGETYSLRCEGETNQGDTFDFYMKVLLPFPFIPLKIINSYVRRSATDVWAHFASEGVEVIVNPDGGFVSRSTSTTTREY